MIMVWHILHLLAPTRPGPSRAWSVPLNLRCPSMMKPFVILSNYYFTDTSLFSFLFLGMMLNLLC
eukprot:UN14644